MAITKRDLALIAVGYSSAKLGRTQNQAYTLVKLLDDYGCLTDTWREDWSDALDQIDAEEKLKPQ